MRSTKVQPNVSCGSGKKVDFIGLVIFSNSGHFRFSTRLNFIIHHLRFMDAVVKDIKSWMQWLKDMKSFEWT